MPQHSAVVVGDDDLIEYAEFAGRLTDASSVVIKPHFREQLSVENKADGGNYDPVTVADQAAETAIRDLIKQTYPEHGIYGEEHGFEAGRCGLTWVIDPIDGTRAFITGVPLWGTLVALHDGEKPILGVMDQPFTGERFVGSRLGAELRIAGRRTALRTRPCAALSEARLQSTHPAMFSDDERSAFEAVTQRVRLTRFSGDCYAYCMVALGCIDLVVESGLLPYDVQALIPIIEASGGVMTDWKGGYAGNGGQVIACGDRRVHEQALRLLEGAARTGR
ncbi:MAG: histidinol-phosphatase [Deltaproteobacteria bacterium]|nr:histidinol-phosphatase [Deltaproteobacteria bacterium]